MSPKPGGGAGGGAGGEPDGAGPCSPKRFAIASAAAGFVPMTPHTQAVLSGGVAPPLTPLAGSGGAAFAGMHAPSPCHALGASGGAATPSLLKGAGTGHFVPMTPHTKAVLSGAVAAARR